PSTLPFMKDSEEPGLAPTALGEMRTLREDEELCWVGALDMGLVAGKDDVDLLVGVDDLVVDLGVGGMFKWVWKVIVELVLVFDLGMVYSRTRQGLDDAANSGPPVRVLAFKPAGLAGLPLEETCLEPGPPEEEGLRSPALVVFNP
ncbi:hypothetical protein Tco_0590840, partial [Tanacetum coccineum]